MAKTAPKTQKQPKTLRKPKPTAPQPPAKPDLLTELLHDQVGRFRYPKFADFEASLQGKNSNGEPLIESWVKVYRAWNLYIQKEGRLPRKDVAKDRIDAMVDYFAQRLIRVWPSSGAKDATSVIHSMYEIEAEDKVIAKRRAKQKP